MSDTRHSSSPLFSPPSEATSPIGRSGPVLRLLRPLASMKLTVALLGVSLFFVLAATLAQTRYDVWEVVEQYINSYFVWIELNVLFPQRFFPRFQPEWGGFWFPGGRTLGILLAVNLVAAHLFRYKIPARGGRLALGLGLLLLGGLTTWLVIAGGMHKADVASMSGEEWQSIRQLFRLASWALALAAATVVGWMVLTGRFRRQKLEFSSAIGGGIFFLILAAYFSFAGEEIQLNDSALRILWLLAKAGAAGGILLAGCMLVYGRRGGLVLLHAGIVLLMLNEVLVRTTSIEGIMSIVEGQSSDVVVDDRSVELVLIDPSDPEKNHIATVPQWMLAEKKSIADERLPFDLRVKEYLPNSETMSAAPPEKNPATAGIGLQMVARQRTPALEGRENQQAAYIELLEKKSGRSLGTYLFHRLATPQAVRLGDKTYLAVLRYREMPRPYKIELIDFVREEHAGTNTPKGYSATIRLIDPRHNVDRETRIWMNNPMRYEGETFYQSSYGTDPNSGREMTHLQVVTNRGWMIPYVASMIVAVGMLAQFVLTLGAFLKKRRAAMDQIEAEASLAQPIGGPPPGRWTRPTVWFPAAVLLLGAGYLLFQALYVSPSDSPFDLAGFGRLPVLDRGRIKPIDSLARNSLRVLSDRSYYKDTEGNRQPAVRWLLDTITSSENAEEAQVVRIRDFDVLNTLDLKKRKGYRYSMAELGPVLKKIDRAVDIAEQKPEENREQYDRKMIELAERLYARRILAEAFQGPDSEGMPPRELFQSDPRKAVEQTRKAAMDAFQRATMLERRGFPLAVPPSDGDNDDAKEDASWRSLHLAATVDFCERLLGVKSLDAPVGSEAVERFGEMFEAYRNNQPEKFNAALGTYQKFLDEHPPQGYTAYTPSRLKWETFFHRWSPMQCIAHVFIAAFVLALLAWLGWTRPFNRASFSLVVLGLVIQTLAIALRVYISGQAPAMSLYTVVVVIGWGCVVLGIILECIFRMGYGNVVAAVTGCLSLWMADLLTTEVPQYRGDTITVLPAVLATQFWLTVHVTSMILGYSATFLAGGLGIVYIVLGVVTRKLTAEVERVLSWMIYGALCFAIFFSFTGTVLGGLWADDSWGRFWGWDPKENGAMIICIWIAIVLHARWDRMVAGRGLAVLAVAGNIAVAWSLFGVNELGVGLHSYGFTEGITPYLLGFVGVQLFFILVGLVPRRLWLSPLTGNVEPDYDRLLDAGSATTAE